MLCSMDQTGHTAGALVVLFGLSAVLFWYNIVPVNAASLAVLVGMAAVLFVTDLPSFPDRLENYTPGNQHRGNEHTVLAALIVAIISGLIGYFAAEQLNSIFLRPMLQYSLTQVIVGMLTGCFVGGVYIIHILLDLTTRAGGFAIQPLKGIDDREVALELWSATDERVNNGLLYLSYIAGFVTICVILQVTTGIPADVLGLVGSLF